MDKGQVICGGFCHLSNSVQDDWALTGGVGIQYGAFHLDASAGASFAKEHIQTDTDKYTDVPTRLNLGLTLKWDVSI